MKSNKGTIATFKSIMLALVVCLSIGILITIQDVRKNDLANSQEIQLANAELIENNIIERNVRHDINSDYVTSRASTTSRFEAHARQQKEEELAEEKKQTQLENIRNISISVDMDLTQRTGLTKEEFKILIGNVNADTSKFFYENSDLIYELCEKYELNEIFFCGLISAESGWTIANNHRRTNNFISLMLNGKLIRYESLEEGLEIAAKTLHTKYLSEGGSFYYGKTLSAMKTRFCPASSTWVNLVYGRMVQIYNSKNIEI